MVKLWSYYMFRPRPIIFSSLTYLSHFSEQFPLLYCSMQHLSNLTAMVGLLLLRDPDIVSVRELVQNSWLIVPG